MCIMNSIQRNIVEFLNDYRHIIKNQAKDFEEHGLETNSWRLKNKILEIESTLKELKKAGDLGLQAGLKLERRKH